MAHQLQHYRDTIPALCLSSPSPIRARINWSGIHLIFFYRRLDIHATLNFSRLMFESGQENKPFETPDREMWSPHDRCLQPNLDFATKYDREKS